MFLGNVLHHAVVLLPALKGDQVVAWGGTGLARKMESKRRILLKLLGFVHTKVVVNKLV